MAVIHVKTSNGVSTQISDVDESGSVAAFKSKVSEKTGIPIEQLRVVFSGHVLKDDKTLADYNLKDGATVHVVRAGAAAAASSSSATAASSSTSASSSGTSLFAPGAPSGNPQAAPPRPSGTAPSGPARTIPPHMRQVLQALAQNPQAFLQMMQSDPRLASDPIAQQALRDPNFLAMLQNPAALAQLFGGGGEGAGPVIPRDVFDVAIRCMNGEPFPEGFPTPQQLAQAQGGSVPGGSASAASRSAQQGTQPQREYVSRQAIAAALAQVRGGAGASSSTTPPSSSSTSSSTPATAPAVSAAPAPRFNAPSSSTASSSASGPAQRQQQQAPQQHTQQQAPAQRFAAQLAQLRSMGFDNEQQCLQALEAAGGDVNVALNFLFG